MAKKKGESKDASKQKAAARKEKRNRSPTTSKLVKIQGVAVAFAVVFCIAAYFVGRMSMNVQTVPPSQTDTLKHIFTSGEPNVVQCINDTVPVHEYTQRVASLLPSNITASAVYCHEPMGSGKNFFERFKITPANLTTSYPHLYLFANAQPAFPLKITKDTTPAKLARAINSRSTPVIHKMTNQKTLEKRCMKPKFGCIVLPATMRNSPWLERLVMTYRKLRFVRLDDRHTLTISAKSPATIDSNQLLHIRPTGMGGHSLEVAEITADAEVSKEDGLVMSSSPVEAFIKATFVDNRTEAFVPVNGLPVIKTKQGATGKNKNNNKKSSESNSKPKQPPKKPLKNSAPPTKEEKADEGDDDDVVSEEARKMTAEERRQKFEEERIAAENWVWEVDEDDADEGDEYDDEEEIEL